MELHGLELLVASFMLQPRTFLLGVDDKKKRKWTESSGFRSFVRLKGSVTFDAHRIEKPSYFLFACGRLLRSRVATTTRASYSLE